MPSTSDRLAHISRPGIGVGAPGVKGHAPNKAAGKAPGANIQRGVYGLSHSHYRYHNPVSSIYSRSRYPSFGVYSYPSYGFGYPYSTGYPYGYQYSYHSYLLDSQPYARSIAPPSTLDAYSYGNPYRSPTISPRAIVPDSKTTESTQAGSGPERLERALRQRKGGEGWLEYLLPHRVIELMKQNKMAGIAELVKRYDGVRNNPDLAAIAGLDGFEATRDLLHQFQSAAPAAAEVPPDPPPIDTAPKDRSPDPPPMQDLLDEAEPKPEPLPIPKPLMSTKGAVEA